MSYNKSEAGCTPQHHIWALCKESIKLTRLLVGSLDYAEAELLNLISKPKSSGLVFNYTSYTRSNRFLCDIVLWESGLSKVKLKEG